MYHKRAMLKQAIALFLAVIPAIQYIEVNSSSVYSDSPSNFTRLPLGKGIPSSCTQMWPGIRSFDSSHVIGRNCAVFDAREDYLTLPVSSLCSPGSNDCSTSASLCSTRYSNELVQYMTTGIITGSTDLMGYFTGKDGGFSTSWVSAASYSPNWEYTSKPPCCSHCTLQGGTVQVYVWPSTQGVNHSISATAASNNNQSVVHTLVSDGFTFTSPSIYVAFETLHAYDDNCGPVGSPLVGATLAFPPARLMTGAMMTELRQAMYYYDWTTMRPQDLTADCGMKTIVGLPSGTNLITDPSALRAASDGYIGREPGFILLRTQTYDPCSPLLSVPTEVFSMEPAWSTCTSGISGWWDPPRVLQAASGPLTPDPTTTPEAETILKSPAAPASTMAPAMATATTSAGPPPKPSQLIPASKSKSSVNPGSSLEPGVNSDPASRPQPGSSQNPSPLPDPGASVGPGAGVSDNGGFHGPSQDGPVIQSHYGSSSSATRANLDPPAPALAITIGSHTAIILPDGGLSVNGATITAGAAPITLDNIPILVASTYAMIGTSILNLPIVSPNLPSLDGHQVEVAPNGDVVVAGTTLSQQRSAATIAATVESLSANGLVFGTSTFAVPTSASNSILPLVGGQKAHVAPDGNVVISGITLSPGGSAATIAGTVVSLGADGFIAGTSTFVVPSPATLSTLPLIGSQNIQVAPNGHVVIAGTTLSPGNPGVMVSGTPITLGSNRLIIGSSTYAVPAPSSDPTLSSIGGQQVQQAANGGLVVADTTLLPGTPSMMISGTSLSLGSAGLIVGSSTYGLPRPTPAAVYTISGETITAGPSSAFLLAGQTISLGGPAVAISGTIVSLGSAGLVVGSKTYSIPAASHEAPPLITFGGQVYTANSLGEFVVGSQTLIPGGVGITISGTPVSLAPSDGDIVVGGQTSSINLGGLIMGGFGDGSMTNSPSSLANISIVSFTGQAVRRSDVRDKYLFYLSAMVILGFDALIFRL